MAKVTPIDFSVQQGANKTLTYRIITNRFDMVNILLTCLHIKQLPALAINSLLTSAAENEEKQCSIKVLNNANILHRAEGNRRVVSLCGFVTRCHFHMT